MRMAGLKPLEPYPGRVNLPWITKCMVCGIVMPRKLNRVASGRGCPSCKGKLQDPEKATKIMRAAGLIPLEDYQGADVPWLCKCIKCEESVSISRNKVQGGRRCKYCNGSEISPLKALETARNAGFEPQEPFLGVAKPWKCKCLTCGITLSMRFAVLRNQGKCTNCTHREIFRTMTQAKLKPLEPYQKSDAIWNCECLSCGTSVPISYTSVKRGSRCKSCMEADTLKNKILKAEERLVELGFRRVKSPKDSDSSWLYECLECAENIEIPLLKLISNKVKCPTCRYASRRLKSLDAQQKVLDIFPGIKFLEKYPGSRTYWNLECGKGHKLYTTYSSLTSPNRKILCKECATPELSEESIRKQIQAKFPGMEFLEPYPGSRGKLWKMLCPRGHTVSKKVSSLLHPNTKYPCNSSECHRRGFDNDAPATLYKFIFYAGAYCIVFGKTGDIEKRMEYYQNTARLTSIQQLSCRDVPVGRIATHIETKMKRIMRKHGIVSLYHDGYEIPGLTEAFWIDDASCEFWEEFENEYYYSTIPTLERYLTGDQSWKRTLQG